MADKSINELVAASSIGATDLFVLQQDNTAKKLPGQVLLNWLTAAADGHGGIQSWVPLKTEGRVTTFRITLADLTYIDIDVVDGRGIEDLKKIKTEGLVDTYQIIYNDGPPSTFTVTNGAKGDPGNDANVWIRYASQKPTADSHSFGEIPDAWIGIAPGHLLTAPTDWQAYTWYKWKGEKGDTGEPAKRLSVAYAYQVGDTGNVIPSGTWQTTIPNVPQGKFLWIRKTTTWNKGDPDVDYSISRMGLDGSGSVSSVADISPDENGNVPLTAEHIGALPNTGGDMAGSINMNGQKIKGLNAPTEDDEPATKGYVDAKKLSMELLWENDSPTSPFETKTFGINFESYDSYVLLTMLSTQYQYVQYSYAPCGKNIAVSFEWADDGVYYSRVFRPDGNYIYVGQGWTSKTKDDNAIIPYQIYGIKGVS